MLYHDDELAGHVGYMPVVCQSIDTLRHKPYGSLQPLPVPERPWKEISLDWIAQFAAEPNWHGRRVRLDPRHC